MIIIIFVHVIFLNDTSNNAGQNSSESKKGGSVPLNQGLCDILVGVIFLFLLFFISSFKI